MGNKLLRDPYDEDYNLNPTSPEAESGTLLVIYKKQASVPSGVSNLSNTILGAGMLGLPFALASSGLVVGAILFFIATMATIFGLHLLAIAAEESASRDNVASYFTVATQTFPRAAVLIDLALIIKCLGVAITYLIIMGSLLPDAMQTVAPGVGILQSRELWLGLSAVICVPLSLLKAMDSLKFTSFLALASVCYIVCLVIYYFFVDGPTASQITLGPRSMEDFFSTLPTFVFAFTCHQNIFAIRNETSDLTKVNQIIVFSVLISLTVYILIGYCGLFTFGLSTKDNIINNLNKTDISVFICRLAVTLLIALSYPLQIHPARICVANIAANFVPNIRKSTPWHFILTFAIVLITYIVAFLVSNLGIVFSLVGATGSVTICYILPGLFYAKLFWKTSWLGKKFFAVLLVVVGILLMINSLIWIIYKEVKKAT
jgi:amino acid permease